MDTNDITTGIPTLHAYMSEGEYVIHRGIFTSPDHPNVTPVPYAIIGSRVLGHWCGYAAIPVEHIDFLDYDDDFIRGLDVHGGVTLIERTESPDGTPWCVLGFDCAHYGDAPDPELLIVDSPLSFLACETRGNIWRFEHVEAEVLSMCRQICVQIDTSLTSRNNLDSLADPS